MKILVTVGSSPFKSLVRAVDLVAKNHTNHEFTFQISSSAYKPESGSYFTFSKQFSDYIDDADVVITHAGAGTVFELLEKEKKCIVVPNYERVDKHQADLTAYLEHNSFAIVCHKLKQIDTCIKQIDSFQAKPYIKEPFFLTEDLINIFK
ncbi:hypothetical protein MTF64_12550 [Pseudoalteromonas sp. 2CM41L]|uniref:PssE/Cps14G family polysaccharide biosynthesis glycosyltransferase n=1 Tax=unclassified Pseudoalteromonas TaxID=194690 RepID=UPI0020BE4DC5|nr:MULTISPECIES: PssE/Cps14G family polysaccharide biosynthesis glycosyltransferase [unclassified Pseudoalteromonas]MCK8107707.1 hypothetical protein [Pseudoalteromonas sp. 2CM41L]MCK8132661.1 hypothetical protein [Pseudoalteromonas sp. 2CM28B]